MLRSVARRSVTLPKTHVNSRISAPVFVRGFATYFTKTHEWVRMNGDGTATLGISKHAQEQLGEVVFIELPEVDGTFGSKETYATLESVKAVAEVYAPVDCEITEANEEVA